MMSGLAQRAGAGFVFGAALTASEIYLRSVIVSQMELEDFHMLNVFLAASASSAIVIAAFENFNIVKRQPRKESSLGWWGPYDANVLGGVLQGVGMALTDADPSTVLVQFATGVKSAILVVLGGLLGGILFTRFGSALKRDLSASARPLDAKAHTIHTKFDINPNYVLLGYETLCLALISGFSALGPNQLTPLLHPMVGGILIGGAQAASLLLTGNAVGISGAYEEGGRFFWDLVNPHKREARPQPNAISFALGVLVAGFALSQSVVLTTVETIDISGLRALSGGCLMIFGSRLAGGCTSGHGISGTSSFSISSIITVAALFVGGIVTAKLLG